MAGLSLVATAAFSSAHKPEGPADPEIITRNPVQTQNGMGMNFPSLGSFEEDFLQECRGLELAEHPGLGEILFLGEAYGRLPMRVLRETGLSNLMVNDLSMENLKPLLTKIISMKKSTNIREVQLGSRIDFVAGDCLTLPTHPRIAGKTNFFDLLMCSNVLHFFDGEQALNFFINTYNFLKPGGKAFLFTMSRGTNYTQEEILFSGQHSSIAVLIAYRMMQAASKDSSLLFPGLADDHWIVEKSNTLKALLRLKPNGLGLTNMIPEATLRLLAGHVGLNVLSARYYEPMLNPLRGFMMHETEEGRYCGLVLEKPVTASPDLPLTIKSLDPIFVEACLSAKERLKAFIDTKLRFIEPFPWVDEK